LVVHGVLVDQLPFGDAAGQRWELLHVGACAECTTARAGQHDGPDLPVALDAREGGCECLCDVQRHQIERRVVDPDGGDHSGLDGDQI
jgi:hypothetical protein